jgi:hypothetical protein
MVTTLSKLVEMIQTGAIPAWLRDEVVANKERISRELRENGVYTLKSPNGTEVIIRAERVGQAA